MENDFYSSNDILNKSRKQRNQEEYSKRRKEKKLLKKKTKRQAMTNEEDNKGNDGSGKHDEKNAKKEEDDTMNILKNENYQIEYVEDEVTCDGQVNSNFKQVLDYFQIPKRETEKYRHYDNEGDEYNEDDDNEYNDEEDDGNLLGKKNSGKGTKAQHLSKRKLKESQRMKLAELKQLSKYPEVVESWDITAQDPKLLIYFKSMKNTVAVPKHWAQKRKYLQNKRGVLRPPFELPEYIEATGISKIRNTELNEKRGLKQKMRDRMQPKLGKMDIDYQVLHDAFFKYQTKPRLSLIGDVYFENKEFETKMKVFQPGRISEELRLALGIPENTPPPFVVNMQRYGPPPSYPNLIIPGVNAPINDPTAEITPNLWTPPQIDNKKQLVWDFNDPLEHWGVVKEIEENEDMDDDDNGDEDLSLSDNENPEVAGLFDNNISNDDNNPPYMNTMKSIGAVPIPNPNASVVYGNHFTKEEGKFYAVVQEREGKVNEGEIHPSNYSYVIPNKTMEKIPEKEKTKESSNQAYYSKFF